ncbi:Putative teichuronic acid biosynthesis glycosyltransferase TuaH [Pseudomonas sp. 22 E 5]|nr:glycosyl transferase [Pseudomonas sp. CFBP13506]CRM92472.1 Putative teichuronic acid biosynthesis glycosyltransferase TuaH [Pseudomonas sp. 22 E 5]
MNRVVILSPLPWESFAQRPHKFVDWLHRRTGVSVLWVDPYPTRLPKWSDLRRLRASPVVQPPSPTPAWLTVLKPGGLPIEPLPGAGWVNRFVWRHALSLIEGFAREAPTLLVVGKPSALAGLLLQRLPHCPSLYDAMDDFPAFYTGFSRASLARWERLIAQRVDVIWASSSGINAQWRGYRDDVHLVHNGLDLAAVLGIQPAPTSSTRKVFGYVGTMAFWFDWGWVAALALARPHDEIRLIGPVFEPAAHQLPPNVVLLPACDHGAALQAMAEFDVGLIPFKPNVLTASVDPIKYYEYRALALPVISTDFGEMHCRSDLPGVFISHSLTDLAALAEAALCCERDADEAHAFALQHSWEARFDATKLHS